LEVLVVEYSGELEITTPLVMPTDHSLVLSYENSYITGSYDSESYSSLANDTHANWDVQVDKKGDYQVQIDLKCKAAPGAYTLQVGETFFPLEVKDTELHGIVGTLKMVKSDKLKVSLYPAEPKFIFSNGYARFNRLMLNEVSITLTRQ
jgi:hypothetical protein